MQFIKKCPAPWNVYALRAFNFVLRRHDQYLVTSNRGFAMICSPRELIQVCIMQFGQWEPNVSAVIESLLRPNSSAIDVGANVGYDTLLMAKSVGAKGRVFSFEAMGQTFAALEKNLAFNSLQNVQAYHMAVSEQAGEITIYPGSASNSGTASIVPSGDQAGEAVSALPLHEALTEDELSRVEFIKIDVEGAETPIVRSIASNLERFPALSSVLVEVSSTENEEAWATIWNAMTANRFVPYAIENDYSYHAQLQWRKPAPLKAMAKLPQEQTDVLFTRADVSHLT